MFDRARCQDINILRGFSVKYILDLMVEKKKVKFGLKYVLQLEFPTHYTALVLTEKKRRQFSENSDEKLWTFLFFL